MACIAQIRGKRFNPNVLDGVDSLAVNTSVAWSDTPQGGIVDRKRLNML